MIEGKTKSGFKYSIDERIKDDWRIIKAISDSESSDASVQVRGTVNLVNLVLGADGSAKLEEHIAKKNGGYVPVQKMTSEITEIFQSLDNSKNS